MADTLRTFVEAMAGVPDNITNLISPQNTREAWLSLADDRGGAFADEASLPITIPIPGAGVWVDIPSTLNADTPGTMLEPGPLFWRMNANGQVAYDYLADWPTTIVPPGYTREVSMFGSVSFDPASGGVYEFAFTVAGVAIPPFVALDSGNQQDTLSASIISGQIIDVSVAPIVSVAVRNTTGAQDLVVEAFSYNVRGGVIGS